MKSQVREPINTYTHLGGALLFLIGTIILFTIASLKEILNLKAILSITIFGSSLVALYATSGIYHMANVEASQLVKLKKLDHAMIFILIAGSYTPFCLYGLNGIWQWAFLTVIWFLAISGITMKIFWINMPRVLSTSMYVLMGWLAVIAIKPLHAVLSQGAFLYLLLGGIMYTIGGVIYAIKKPNISKNFGFHELFHIFCLLGSGCHYYALAKYIL